MKHAILEWNFWWDNPYKLREITGIKRDCLLELKERLRTSHIKDVIGVRRSGKTILLYQVISHLIEEGVDPKNILYLNFDDPNLNDLEKSIKVSLEINFL